MIVDTSDGPFPPTITNTHHHQSLIRQHPINQPDNNRATGSMGS